MCKSELVYFPRPSYTFAEITGRNAGGTSDTKATKMTVIRKGLTLKRCVSPPAGHMTDLVYTEKELVQSLRDYIKAEESKLAAVKRFSPTRGPDNEPSKMLEINEVVAESAGLKKHSVRLSAGPTSWMP